MTNYINFRLEKEMTATELIEDLTNPEKLMLLRAICADPGLSIEEVREIVNDRGWGDALKSEIEDTWHPIALTTMDNELIRWRLIGKNEYLTNTIKHQDGSFEDVPLEFASLEKAQAWLDKMKKNGASLEFLDK